MEGQDSRVPSIGLAPGGVLVPARVRLPYSSRPCAKWDPRQASFGLVFGGGHPLLMQGDD